MNEWYTGLVGGNIVLCALIFLVNGWAARQIGYSKMILKVNLAVFLFYAFLMAVITLVVFRVFREREKMEYYKKQQENLREYAGQMEKLYQGLSSFKAEYTNILSDMSEYLEEKDYKGFKQYFNEQILPANQKMNRENYRLAQLSNIKNSAVKGVLASKLIYAHTIGMDVYIDIMDEIYEYL